MASSFCDLRRVLLAVFFTSLAVTSSSLPSSAAADSVLVGLFSRYTELAELVEKALLLPSLEDAIGRHNLTIFAFRDDALDSDLKRFLLEPRNLRSLQSFILFHVLPTRITSGSWPASRHRTLAGDDLRLSSCSATAAYSKYCVVDLAVVIHPDAVIHGIDRPLIPQTVQDHFNSSRSLAALSAVLPVGMPEVDPRTHHLKNHPPSAPGGTPAVLPIYDATAPVLALAPAPEPGQGSGNRWFDGADRVGDFIHTLVLYGGYNDVTDIMVNLTSLATEIGRLVSEGYAITVMAPSDEAMAKLKVEQLSGPVAPEAIMYYHLIPEYQTEESMYNAVQRFGKVGYDRLRPPHKVVAREAGGVIKLGSGEESAYLFDPDIYTDGRISVQGIDAMLFPPEEVAAASSGPIGALAAKKVAQPTAVKPRRAKEDVGSGVPDF